MKILENQRVPQIHCEEKERKSTKSKNKTKKRKKNRRNYLTSFSFLKSMARRRRKLESELQNPNIGDEKLKLSLSNFGNLSSVLTSSSGKYTQCSPRWDFLLMRPVCFGRKRHCGFRIKYMLDVEKTKRCRSHVNQCLTQK